MEKALLGYRIVKNDFSGNENPLSLFIIIVTMIIMMHIMPKLYYCKLMPSQVIFRTVNS